MLKHVLEFRPEQDSEFFAALPASAAVFILRGESNAEPYVSKSSNLRRRMLRLLSAPETNTKRLNLRYRVCVLEYQPVGSDFEAGLVLYKVQRAEFPKTYDKRLHLHPAPLVKFIRDNRFPRLAATTRISSLKSANTYYGPFPTRAAADKFAEDSLDFFLIRRCTDDLMPDPKHPGCVYSEMKKCIAPCYCGCTEDQYAAEVENVRRYLDSSGQSLIREIMRARDEASEKLEFEAAATAHAKLERLRGVVNELPEIVHRLDSLRALIVQPSSEAGFVSLFKVERGMIGRAIPLRIAMQQEVGEVKTPMSMESRILGAMASVPDEAPHSAQEWMEHIALLKRWYYRTAKLGEVFIADEKGELPMRRIVRGVARVFKGEKPQGDLSETAGDYWRFRYGEFINKSEVD